MLAVVWGVGLIAILVVAFMTSGRLRLQMAFNVARATEAGFVADSAINLQTLTLLARRETPVTGAENIHDGAPNFCVLDGAAVAVAVEEESGKIDLNAAPLEMLRAAFVGLGVDERRAQDVANAVVAYRTAPAGELGQIAAPSGDKPLPLKQGPFETVMELDQVDGVDPNLFRALLPFVTVHSKSPSVDARASPPALFAALAGFPVEDVRSLSAAPYPNNLKRNDPRFPANFNQTGEHNALVIHAEVVLASGQSIAKEALVDLRPAPGRPFSIKEIRRGQSRYAERLRAMISSNGAGAPDC